MSDAQHGARCDEEYVGGVQVIILPTSRHIACPLSLQKQPATSPGAAPPRRALDAHKHKMTPCSGTACSRAHRPCPPDGWHASNNEWEQSMGRADCIQMRYPACDEQHTEQKLQPAKQDLHRAQASTNRQECDADLLAGRLSQAKERHSQEICIMQERLGQEASERLIMKDDMEQLSERMHAWRDRLQSELGHERHEHSKLKLQLSSSKDKVEKLQAQLEQSRRQNTDSNSGIPNSDALCKQLRDELESSQRTAAMENNRLQLQIEGLRGELSSCQREHAELQMHTKQLTRGTEEARAASKCSSKSLKSAEQDLQQAHEDCDKLTERAEQAEDGMLKASRRADVAERQLQRRESEAGHLTQKQAYTEQALQDLHEQHAQAGAAAAARQLVMHTQAAELKEAREVLAQATAKALQLEKDLQEACRQLAVLAEDDQDLRDKVHMLTEALNLATQRLAAAGRDQQQFLERETKATKMLHAAAAEAEVLRGALQAAEDKAGGCEAQQARLQSCLAEAQAELADSRSRLADISGSHCAELAARAHAAAQRESTLAREQAVCAKLSAEVSESKASQSLLQERLTTATGERDRAEAELALATSALAACKRRLSSACAENVLLVGAFDQTMQEHAQLTCTAPPD